MEGIPTALVDETLASASDETMKIRNRGWNTSDIKDRRVRKLPTNISPPTF